jgi:3-phenylpropionate/cinnamic acid dioxygenase small subunit
MLTRDEAERLLFEEARLLDERRLQEWLELFAPDAIYWVPIDDERDPGEEPSIIYDDRTRMEERVFRLLDTPAHSQMPPSRTQHDISNVEIVDGGENGSAHIRCNLTLHEVRIGDPAQVGLADRRVFAGRCEYVLEQHNGAWKIARKVVNLLDRELPHYNLTFII